MSTENLTQTEAIKKLKELSEKAGHACSAQI